MSLTLHTSMSSANIKTWLNDWSRAWNTPDLCDRINLEPSPRLRRSLGRCHPATGRIRLHPALFKGPPELLREVVCHEAAHVAVHLLHGKNARPHGREWARLMRAAGYEPRTRMNLEKLPEAVRSSVRPSVLYCHRCPVCGASRLAPRPVRRWRCRSCHESGLEGRLEISTIPAAASGQS